MARKKQPKLDVCKIRPDRFRYMTSKQLMNVWARLGASAPAKRKVVNKIKALVVDLAVAADHRYATTEQGRHTRDIYTKGAERTIHEIYDLQAKAGCQLKPNEFVARDAERAGRTDVAQRLRRKAIIR